MRKRKSTSQSKQLQSKKAKTKKIKRNEDTPELDNLRTLLSNILKAPTDIVNTILSYLQPCDLLWLARSTKEFRNFLMNEESHLVWQACRNNLYDIPPKPDDMDEPAFASLLYDDHCSECLGPDCTTVFWEWRKRLCLSCEKDLKLRDIDFYLEFNPPFITKDGFLRLVPFCTEKTRYYTSSSRPFKLQIDKERFGRPFWIESIANAYIAEYNSEVNDEASFARWKERLEAEKVEREKHTEICIPWYKWKLRKQVRERKALAERRYVDILDRLGGRRPLGLRFHSKVNVPRKLTDGEWETIRPTLEAEFPRLPDIPRKDPRLFDLLDLNKYVKIDFEKYFEMKLERGFDEFLSKIDWKKDFKNSGYWCYHDFWEDYDGFYYDEYQWNSGFYGDCLEQFVAKRGYDLDDEYLYW